MILAGAEGGGLVGGGEVLCDAGGEGVPHRAVGEAAPCNASAFVGAGQEIGVEPLEAFFARVPRFAVAFSGGCDSSYLLAAARAAGCDACAYLVKTAFQAPFELEDARRVSAETGARMEIVEADALARPEVCANGPDRCYRCKRFLLEAVLRRMRADGYDVLADGTNASDDPARRPGFRALAELGVVSPLRRAGMGKEAVRAASRKLGLSTAEKPSFSCLATKVAPGMPITVETLRAAAVRAGVADGMRPWEPPVDGYASAAAPSASATDERG